jgi:hypothetical protein
MLNDTGQSVWGRPVDTAIGLDGSMFISDDQSGTVYKMTPTRNEVANITKAGDDGSRGTLSFALANSQSGDIITFDPLLNISNPAARLTFNISSNLPALKAGVTLNGGSCLSGPRVTFNGPGAPGNGLVLNGGTTLKNLALQNFPAKQLVVNRTNGPNRLGPCLVVKG